MKRNKKYLSIAAALMFYANAFSSVGFAESYDDIDRQIEEQRIILDRLNEKKNREKNDHLAEQIDDLRNQLESLRYNRDEVYDAESAIHSIAVQLSDLQIELENQQSIQQQLAEAIDRLGRLMEERRAEPAVTPSASSYYTSGSHLINPGPTGNLSYTQDAINSQGNSTTVFKYAPNQIYKIYCRTGYITDLCFKKGEKIRFVGGGDTSAWAVNSTTVDNTPHVYIKPVVPTSTTNIIVTTDKRSYQLIVNTSEWYNPMICWTYDGEEHVANLLHTDGIGKKYDDPLTSKNSEDLNLNYTIKSKSEYKPSMVFDDGEKTFIKFKGNMSKRLPAIFIREKGRKSVSIANYKTVDDGYVLDCLVDQAEIRFSDTDVVSIKRKK